MRILQLTAGAAGMYCGTCLRDNSLASELMRQGHDVTLVPLYTPTLTDERNVSQERIFFGGISVYLEQNWSLFRKTPWLLDRLWDSKFALQAAAKRTIPVDPHFLGGMTVSMIEGEHGRLNKEVQKMLEWLETEPPPDVINLPYTLLIGLAEPLKRALEVPICCTLQGEDLFLEGLTEPYKSRALGLIRKNIPHVDCFLAVSDYYAEFMCRYLGIPEHKMEIARVGVNTDGYRSGPQQTSDGGAVETKLGYFARIAPEKGLHVLAEAYRIIRQQEPNCTLEAAGYMAPEHRAYLDGIERQMKQWDLPFHYHGVLDRAQKIAYLESLDVLSTPTVYADPKGLFVLEGMAAGVPFVQPRHGAFPEIAERTGGGILVEPEDPESLAQGLLEMIRNRELRAELAQKAYRGVREHYTVAQMAEQTIAIFAESKDTFGNVMMLDARNISKSYPTPRGPLQILTDISLQMEQGESISIVGPSGSGKSTLLYILGALEPPTSGTVTLSGRDPFTLSDKELSAFRNKEVGFVFQDHCLLPQCSVLENVLIPEMVAKHSGTAQERAKKLLEDVGLSHRLEHRPGELSGGEKQRVAIARALIRSPKLLLCDEPTGNLDRKSAAQVADLLLEINKTLNTILIVVTHSAELAARFPKSFELVEGGLQSRMTGL